MRDVTHFDAIVVGSGISGGWAAKELTERGMKTLVLEAGGPVDPRTDYVEHVQPWEMHFRGLGNRKALERDHPARRRAQLRGVDDGAADRCDVALLVGHAQRPAVELRADDQLVDDHRQVLRLLRDQAQQPILLRR